MLKKQPGVSMIPVNPTDRSLIAANDTATFSEKMSLYLLSSDKGECQYIEPLGDGFYFSPVTMSWENGRLSISSERDHEWTIYVSLPEPPQTIAGADTWEYDQDKQQLVIKKTALQVNISIK